MVHDKGKYKLVITLLNEELKSIPTEDEPLKQESTDANSQKQS